MLCNISLAIILVCTGKSLTFRKFVTFLLTHVRTGHLGDKNNRSKSCWCFCIFTQFFGGGISFFYSFLVNDRLGLVFKFFSGFMIGQMFSHFLFVFNPQLV